MYFFFQIIMSSINALIIFRIYFINNKQVFALYQFLFYLDQSVMLIISLMIEYAIIKKK